jgi:putative tryptophan/tyrosine transport system substrate-binding protein
MIRRREFMALLGGAAATCPLGARAQQSERIWRIGFILGASPPSQFGLGFLGGLAQGMRELGYAEGRDFVIEWRSALGDYDRFPAIAAELVRLKVDVFVLGTTAALPAVQQATSTIPIVLTNAADPVGQGFVPSLAKPGGNITGLSTSAEESAPKQLELLAAAVPNLSRLGLLTNPNTSVASPVAKSAQSAAQKAGVTIVPVQAGNPQMIENAFATLAKERAQAVMVITDPLYFAHRQQLAELALKHRLASLVPLREYVEAGGLMSYGEALGEFYRRTAYYVDKIFKGAKPADLPIEQPRKFNLVINRKTADALGITIPPILYIFADEVIE